MAHTAPMVSGLRHVSCVRSRAAAVVVHLGLFKLAQVLALEPPPYKCIPQPSYECIACRKRQAAESDRGDQRLAFTSERVQQHTHGRQGKREQRIGLGRAQGGRHDDQCQLIARTRNTVNAQRGRRDGASGGPRSAAARPGGFFVCGVVEATFAEALRFHVSST